MKTAIITAVLALAAITANAQTPTPGYDRPGPDNHQTDEHAHVVYWSSSFDKYDIDMQVAADATSADDLVKKNDRREMDGYNRRHHYSK